MKEPKPWLAFYLAEIYPVHTPLTGFPIVPHWKLKYLQSGCETNVIMRLRQLYFVKKNSRFKI